MNEWIVGSPQRIVATLPFSIRRPVDHRSCRGVRCLLGDRVCDLLGACVRCLLGACVRCLLGARVRCLLGAICLGGRMFGSTLAEGLFSP